MPRILTVFWMLFLLALPAGLAAAQEASPTGTPTATVTDRPAVRRSTATPTQTATPTPTAFIRAPQTGQALQGSISITGSSAMAGFTSAELYFGYANNPTGTWFLLAASSRPVSDGTLAEWDTTTITDGEYTLRLVVNLEGSEPFVATVEGLRVRNYSPVETSTPTPVTPTATPAPGELPVSSATPSPTITPPAPTPTNLPRNPAEVSTPDITRSLGRGALLILGFFALMGIYQAAKNIRERS